MIRLVLRSLSRNRWRTVLTVGGVAIGVAMIVWVTAFTDAYLDSMAHTATAGQLGSLQIHDADYAKKRSLWDTLDDDPQQRAAIARLPGVDGVAPRLTGMALIGRGQRSRVAVVLGVDALEEPKVTVVKKGLKAGRWLSDRPPDPPALREVVLGKGLAEHLEVGPGDELVANLVTADGSPGDDRVTVVGVLQTGSVEIDRTFVYMHLADAQYLSVLDGKLHEIAIGLAAGADLDAAKAAILPHVPEGALLQTWKELVPDLVQMIEVSQASIWMFYLIIFALIALGILNTQRMSALERRREFGVLVAIGTTPNRLGLQLVLESIFLSTVGALLGIALGAAIVAYHAANGLDMSAFASSANDVEGFSWAGISFDNLIYFRLDYAKLLPPIIWTAAVALLCGLWPAVKAARANPVTAISGRG
ncbi:MAG: ABC transporter permease [Deltaproteobacteria bacterium]|nr:MAG: ABC transporter permease [Deltaproteobacteria bacterium]